MNGDTTKNLPWGKVLVIFYLYDISERVPVLKYLFDWLYEKTDLNSTIDYWRCVCCGNRFNSSREANLYAWHCSTRYLQIDNMGFKHACPLAHPTLHRTPTGWRVQLHCEDDLHCPLKTDRTIQQQRQQMHQIMRREVYRILRRFGHCLLYKNEKEVLRAFRTMFDRVILWRVRLGKESFHLLKLKKVKRV